MKYIGGIILIVAVVILIGVGIYQFKRSWNYSWGYESKVQGTVCEMVKPELLKDPEQCQ